MLDDTKDLTPDEVQAVVAEFAQTVAHLESVSAAFTPEAVSAYVEQAAAGFAAFDAVARQAIAGAIDSVRQSAQQSAAMMAAYDHSTMALNRARAQWLRTQLGLD